MSQNNKLGPGTVLADRYKLTEMIGRGGFGAVWRARQLNMDRDVAIKILPPQFMSLQDVVERFKREAKLASRLRHPNTITLHDYGKHRNLLYIVMELLTGEDLADVLKREGKLPPERIISIARQVLKSLSEAHDQNIVHRDLKPENIFLSIVGDERDYVKVLDFGIAKLLQPEGGTEPSGRRLTMSGSTVGTPTYMSPEQAAGEDVDPRTDIYALGIILYETLNGRPPFNNKDPIKVMRAQLFDPVPPLRDERLRGTVLDRVIQKALQKDPNHRFQSASDMLLALAQEAVAQPVIQGIAPEELEEMSASEEFLGPNTGDFEPRFQSTLSFIGSIPRDRPGDEDKVPFGVVDAHADTMAPGPKKVRQSPPSGLRASTSNSSIITPIDVEAPEEPDAPVILLTRKKDDTSEERMAAERPSASTPKPKSVEAQAPQRVTVDSAPLPPSPKADKSDEDAGSWGWDPSAEVVDAPTPLPKKEGIGFWIVLVVIGLGALAAVFMF